MRRVILLMAAIMLLAGGFVSCGEKSTITNIENFDCVSCENKEIVKVLNDEPAYVRKQCFDYRGRTDAFYIELVNPHSEFFSKSGLFPCVEIPEQYRQEGLSVSISGDLTSCVIGAGCSAPNIKLAYIHLFELKSIKINN